MSPRTRLAALTATLAALVCAAPAGAAFDPVYELSNFSKTQERFLHVVSKPEYQALLREKSAIREVQGAQIIAGDPQRFFFGQLCWQKMDGCAGEVRAYDWSTRGAGLATPVSWVARNGSVISGHVWATAEGPATRPGVVLTTGSVQAPEELYWTQIQTLAKAGYVVLTWDVQGQGYSDTFGEGADRMDGVPSQSGRPFYDGTEDALDFFFSTAQAPYAPRKSCTTGTSHADKQAARLAAGKASAYNPFAAMLDRSKVGIVGQSLGAGAVSYIGQIDPRVKAIVAYDNLSAQAPDATAPPQVCDSGASPRPAAVTPRVPAMGISNDYGLTPQPNFSEPDPDGKTTASKRYSAAGVDSMQLVVRGGTRYESLNIPNPAFGATLRGTDLTSFYALAWMDRYVKGDEAARARLLTQRFRNDPAGAAVDPDGDPNDLSRYYKSRLDIAGPGGTRIVCESLREGCAALAAEGSADVYDATKNVQAKESGTGPGLTLLKSICAVNTTDPVGATGAPPAVTTTTPACDPRTGIAGTPGTSGASAGVPAGPAPGGGAAPTPAAARPTPAASRTCADRFRPVSRFRTVRLRRNTLTLRGTSSDRGCETSPGRVTRVQVSIAREVGRTCRFLKANGRFSSPRSCRRTSYLKARGTRTWTYRARTRFPRGRYKIYVRATDARRNVERKAGKRTLRKVRLK